MDNLSTHGPGSLYEAFPAPEAHHILQRIEIHDTPSTPAGSLWWRWRSVSSPVSASTDASGAREIALGDRCLGKATQRCQKARINWMFNTEKAREKLAHAYPDTTKVKES